MSTELHFVDGHSSKFYRVGVAGCEVTKTWGRIGTKGQSATSVAATPEAAEVEAAALLAGKRSKGYRPVGEPEPERSSSDRVLPDVKPMLAHPGTPDDLIDRPRYLWSLKLDGVRCLAHYDGSTVRLINRRDVDITARYPDIVEALEARLLVPCVLDGELVAFGPDGKPSFTLIAQRDQASKAATIAAAVQRVPATFMVFDLPCYDGRDLRQAPLRTRLQQLDSAVAWGNQVQLVTHQPDGATMWKFVLEHQLEGLVGKDAESRYVGTRSRNWIKVKTLQRVSCVATSYEHGIGARAATIGAVNLSMFDGDGKLVGVGRVGTGFTVAMLAECKQLLDSGQPFVAEIECLSLGTGGQLRHPSFKGIRRDLGPSDCTVSQLDTLPRT